MIPLLTADEMRAAERQAIEGWGIPSLILQEHAALGALALLPQGEPLQVLAGPGNNGGDALALARLARLEGREVTVWSPSLQSEWRGDAAIQARLWKGLGGEVQSAAEPAEIMRSWRGWVVDGLLGLGTTRPLDGPAAAWVRALNASGLPVLALDLPSGLDPSTAEIPGEAVRARRTACFGAHKVLSRPSAGQGIVWGDLSHSDSTGPAAGGRAAVAGASRPSSKGLEFPQRHLWSRGHSGGQSGHERGRGSGGPGCAAGGGGSGDRADGTRGSSRNRRSGP